MNRFLFFIFVSCFLLGLGNLSATKGEPDWAALEKKFPRHFKGMSKVDFEFAEEVRQKFLKSWSKGYVEEIPSLEEKYKTLLKILESKKEDGFSQIKEDIQSIIGDPRRRQFPDYIGVLLRCLLTVSSHSEKAEDFLRVFGFKHPYTDIKTLNPNDTNAKFFGEMLFSTLLDSEDRHNDSHSFRYFSDNGGVEDRLLLSENKFSRVPEFLIEEDILGLFTLTLTYLRGIHPVPIPLKKLVVVLHNTPMDSWAQVCHDIGHSEVDSSDPSLRIFADFLLNKYTDALKKELPNLSQEEKARYGIKKVLPHIVTFACEVHNLYRQSLVDMMLSSLSRINPEDPQTFDVFEGFSTGAFYRTHERTKTVSYHSPDLVELLKLSAFETILKKEEASEEDLEEGKENLDSELKDIWDRYNFFETSYLDGTTKLSDADLYEKVKNLDLKFFASNGDIFPPFAENLKDENLEDMGKINLDEVSEYKVERHELYIDVLVDMIDGQSHIFRQRTKRYLFVNFEHDRGLLHTARKTLKSIYDYDVPSKLEIEKMDPKILGEAVKDHYLKLEKGLDHLQDYFLEKAIELVQKPYDASGRSIAEGFEAGYREAMEKVMAHFPSFVIEDFEGFVGRAKNSEKTSTSISTEVAEMPKGSEENQS